MDFFPTHVIQCVHKIQKPNEVVAFDEKLPIETPNWDVSSSGYSHIEILNK